MTNLNLERTVTYTLQGVNPRRDAHLRRLPVKCRVFLPGAVVSVIVSAQGENTHVS